MTSGLAANLPRQWPGKGKEQSSRFQDYHTNMKTTFENYLKSGSGIIPEQMLTKGALNLIQHLNYPLLKAVHQKWFQSKCWHCLAAKWTDHPRADGKEDCLLREEYGDRHPLLLDRPHVDNDLHSQGTMLTPDQVLTVKKADRAADTGLYRIRLTCEGGRSSLSSRYLLL